MPGTSAGLRKGWKKRQTASYQRERAKTLAKRLETRKQEFELLLAQENASSRGSYFSGIQTSLYKLTQEYNPALATLDKRLAIYQQMANGDAKVAAQLSGRELPLWSAVRWKAEGGTQEMRDLIEQNILRKGDRRFWCSTSWMHRLHEKMSCLQNGFALHAKVRDKVDGYTIFREMVYLEPMSLGGPLGPWEWDKSGRLVAVHRKYSTPGENKAITDERIPIEDISASVWWMTGENWEGTALIRPMYGAWKRKDLATKIGMIALLNGGVGIPMATLGPSDGPAAQTTLKQMAGDLRQGSKERQFLILGNGQKIEFLTTNGQIVDARPIVDEQNMEMASAGTTDFMQQGQTNSGSRASGSVLMVPFMQTLEAQKLWVLEQINHGAGYLQGDIEELIYMNFGPVKECAYLTGSVVSPTEQLDNVPNILDAVQKGGLTHDLEVENHVRRSLGVKEISQEEFEAARKAAQTVNVGGRPNEVGPSDVQDPRNDTNGRRYGLRRKGWDGESLPLRSRESYPWQTSMRA